MTRTHVLFILLSLLTAGTMAPRTVDGQVALIDVQYKRKAEMLCPLAVLLPPAVPATDPTFRIGILGRDPFQGQDEDGNAVNFLDVMAAQKGSVNKRRIVIQRFSSVKDYRPCHVLFLSAQSAPESDEGSADERLAAILKRAPAAPVLLVADSEGLAEQGAAVNFFVGRDDAGVPKVKFEVNPAAAKRAGLTIHPGLLRLADRIVGDKVNRDDPGAR
jgi:hypothetical protein